MINRLKGSFNVYTLIPVFHDNSGWWCTEPTKGDTFIDYSQSDLDIAVRNTEIAYECQAVIIVHKNFTSEVRTFINYVNCDEKVLIELLRKGSLRGLVL